MPQNMALTNCLSVKQQNNFMVRYYRETILLIAERQTVPVTAGFRKGNNIPV